MAYINQETKAAIHAELKKVMPKSWKWSLSIRDHSTLTLTVAKADVDVIGYANEYNNREAERRGSPLNTVNDYLDVNNYWFADIFESHPEFVAQLQAIYRTIKTAGDWSDNSRAEVDYFDTAFYIRVQFGKWDKPFQFVEKQ